MNELVTLGELLIDFTPAGKTDGKSLFMQNAGGAVANVAAAAAQFGIRAAFMGMVGDDAFGHYLKQTLADKGVDTGALVMTEKYGTTLAFVHLFSNGERDFTFYRKPGADIMFTEDHIDQEKIENAKVFHFGSLSLTDEPVRSATYKVLDIAKSAGVTVSYDPNYRAPLWDNEQQAKEAILKGLAYADILKISDNEIELLYGDIAYEDAAKMLIEKGAGLVFITMGSQGAVYANAKGTGFVPGFSANAIDATGAGDCFTASVLYQILHSEYRLDDIAEDQLQEITCFANAAASICVERSGGIPAMPTLSEVNDRLQT